MKQFLFSLLTVTLFFMSSKDSMGQSSRPPYEKEWKKVEEFVKKQLPQSALAEVKKIKALAIKDRAEAQQLKCLIFMAGLQTELQEDNKQQAILDLEKELPGASPTAKAILQSLQAELYWQKFLELRWRLYDRSNTVDFKKDDINTWTTDDFHKKISALYLQSLSQEKLLQGTKLEPYDAILVKGNSRHLRPTLWDLLAHRALEYFKNDERNISKPAYAFEINQAAAMDPAADFVHRKFTTTDSLSLQHKALLLYQKLIAFHLNDAKPDALIDADLDRLLYVRSHSVHEDKDEQYFLAVNHIAHQYNNLPAAAQAWYLVAAYYQDQGNSYEPFGDTTHRYSLIKAKEICQQVLNNPLEKASKDSSEGFVNAYNLLQQLNLPSLQLKLEGVNVPGQPFRSLISYKNLSTLHLRLVKATKTLRDQFENSYDEKYWTVLLGAPAVRSWSQSMPATNDLQEHSAEIKVDALEPGQYFLLAGSAADFTSKKTLIGAALFNVSAISYVNRDRDYFVLDRETGQPLKGASITSYTRAYDYKQSKYVLEKGQTYTSNDKGFFQLPQPAVDKQNRYSYNILLDITYQKDRLFLENEAATYYYRQPQEPAKPVPSLFLFTDRSLYRPGQQLFVKGILLIRQPGSMGSDILINYSTTLYLRDMNGQDIDSVKVTSNDYGSFQARFQLPASGLTGHFTLYTKKEQGSAGINVEEYKRPKFSVEYEALKGAYQVGDTIEVTGQARAYAGNNIDGAKVSYRVVRQARFPYPIWGRKIWLPPVQPMEITHGETVTDAQGRFRVRFEAIPDKNLDKKTDPAFDYVVYADVTDINGETRSAEKTVTASYKSLMIRTSYAEQLPADSLHNIRIFTENNNSEWQAAKIQVRLIRLKEEKRLIRQRLWNQPDQFTLSKEEYIRLFPNDEYADETNYKSWEKGATALEKTDSSKATGNWITKGAKQTPGHYILEVTTWDKNGAEVKSMSYLHLYDEKNALADLSAYSWTNTLQPIEPGQKATLEVATAADNLFIIQATQRGISDDNNTVSYNYFPLNKEAKKIDFNVSESDRGGINYSLLFVKHNRVHQQGELIRVPWSNKELSIEYLTYRDKTLPGSEEKWKVRIKGEKTDKLAAELLVSMYDASLDQFYPHNWNKPDIWLENYSRINWNSRAGFGVANSNIRQVDFDRWLSFEKQYDYISHAPGLEYSYALGGAAAPKIAREMKMSAPAPVAEMLRNAPGIQVDAANGYMNESADTVAFAQGDGMVDKSDASNSNAANFTRKSFNETAFFFPQLRTDSTGAVEFSFTMPEALTTWKLQALAHTKDLALGYSTRNLITQKQLMVQPNMPRFLREGDKMEWSAKIVNLSEGELTGQAQVEVLDAATNQPLDSRFHVIESQQYFTVAAGQSEVVKFAVEIPFQFDRAVTYRIVAKAGQYSDGEEASLPVLSNRMLVTESLPIYVNGAGTRQFSFDKLKQSGNSETLQSHALTVEYSSNPAWYAVQALPYLMEYPYECAEQTWNRYYANALATSVANSSPKLRQVFEQWKNTDTAALLSNLQKNQELKAILLEETPWVLQAKTEAEQKRNIALLFDLNRMAGELSANLEKLKQMQSSNGGFVWFKGGPDDRYITQYILTGIGHLRKLNVLSAAEDKNLKAIADKAIPYLDQQIKKYYDQLVKSKTNLSTYTLDYSTIQYFYMRSFFSEYKTATAAQKAVTYFKGRLPLSWTKQNKYMQGMLALILHRQGDSKTSTAILKSLKETSIVSEELGRYWKINTRSWWWYEAPIERQALLIEAFMEAGKDVKTADELRTWLLRNKQTNSWESTRATAEACYALLLQGTKWLEQQPAVVIRAGSVQFDNSKSEAGTGYFKQSIQGEKIKPDMGNISLSVTQAPGSTTTAPSWGAVYWQYFEDLDKISSAATPLQLKKKLFVEQKTDRGPVLKPVADGDYVKVGDKIVVRIELRADRDMEYVHMKDMRASALEPVNVLSSYKWQGGLGYYESTRDAGTHFFFSYLPKGTYVFEYSLFVTHTGDFSNGVTSIQCMYAPEFNAHSEGVRILVD
ncbi:MAG: alpha-2-macroglobulin family protein [Chitinophagaceae bacterium]